MPPLLCFSPLLQFSTESLRTHTERVRKAGERQQDGVREYDGEKTAKWSMSTTVNG